MLFGKKLGVGEELVSFRYSKGILTYNITCSVQFGQDACGLLHRRIAGFSQFVSIASKFDRCDRGFIVYSAAQDEHSDRGRMYVGLVNNNNT